MDFQDQSHINRVRDALWGIPNSYASVMIGSGFSRNALPTQSKNSELPTWDNVSSQLYDALYPRSYDERSGCTPSTGAEGMLRTAQEYHAAFGRTALHGTLRRLVQDEEYNPGPIHRRLLRLPWRDIYTTNWDTLLEKTASIIPERPYSVIRNMDEIPMSNHPRIVKLHGTFGSQYPLIVTEEDYRIYPKQYAPFVNTVQQAMMETVFCLIGFSGNDPNFLSWSGWVRDNLGESAPRIYLAGFLGLSPHRRRMLEERNVVPIDLANHPKAHRWPPELRHTLATEWLLHTLERGRPYDSSEWPDPTTRRVNEIQESMRDLILPIDEMPAKVPKAETPFGQVSDEIGQSNNAVEVVRENLAIWNHNRKIYPGWLFVPNSTRQGLSDPTNELERHILSALKDLTTLERLNALRELVWRKSILLEPISSELEDAVKETLMLIDCPGRTIDGGEAPSVDWADVRQAWRKTAMQLVTASRYRWDRQDFERRVESLREFAAEDQDIYHGIAHERCLWALNYSDFQDLDQLLSFWRTEDCDPVWMMRKSALQSEAGYYAEAQVLIEKALGVIRAIPFDSRSIGMQSREGWALLSTGAEDPRQDIVTRLNELALLKCDPRQEIRAIEAGLRPDGNEENPPSFGIGHLPGSRVRWTNYQPQLEAYRASRFSELAGLPSTIQSSFGPVDLCANILKTAAEEVAGQCPEIAIRLVLRCCRNDKEVTLEKVVSRTRVATLTPEQADILAKSCERAIETCLGHVLAGNEQRRITFWTERIRVAIEVLGRLVLRLEPHRAETILDKALEYYQNPQLARHRGLSGPIRNLLEYSWASLPRVRRDRRIFDLLNAPIAGLDVLLPRVERQYPEPVMVLAEYRGFPKRTEDNEDLWQAAIDLIVRGLRGDRAPRERAAFRAWYLSDSKLMRETESLQIAEALWNPTKTPTDDLPRDTGLADPDLLYLPELESGMAQERFRKKWLSPPKLQVDSGGDKKDLNASSSGKGTSSSTSAGRTLDTNTILSQAGAGLRVCRMKGSPLTFSDEENQYLALLIEQWVDTPLPMLQGIPIVDQGRTEPLLQALEGLPFLVEEISLSSAVAEKLLSRCQELNRRQIPAHLLTTSLIGTLPERLEDIVTSLRIGLTSSDIEMAHAAADSLVKWLERSKDPKLQIPAPPDDLIREIGIAIASRRIPALVGALRAATWIFDEGTIQQQETISSLVQDGMNFLALELNYGQENYDEAYVPLLRLFSARLTVAMAKAGMRYEPAVAIWLASAYTDPFPEIKEEVSDFFDAELKGK